MNNKYELFSQVFFERDELIITKCFLSFDNIFFCECDLLKRTWVIILPVSKNLDAFRLEIERSTAINLKFQYFKYGFIISTLILRTYLMDDSFDVLKVFTKMLT